MNLSIINNALIGIVKWEQNVYIANTINKYWSEQMTKANLKVVDDKKMDSSEKNQSIRRGYGSNWANIR